MCRVPSVPLRVDVITSFFTSLSENDMVLQICIVCSGAAHVPLRVDIFFTHSWRSGFYFSVFCLFMSFA